MYFAMTVDDVALRDWSKPKNFQHLIEFFVQEGLSATFFVVPIDEETGKPFYTLSNDYIPLIRDGMAAGLNFEQHGLRHNRFELGIPPAMVLDLPHEVENKRYAKENKAFLEQEHSVANCRKRLAQGKRVLEDAFEAYITGFRAPALQESPGMFTALKEEGYCFDSSKVLQETGWDYILDKMDVPPRKITRARWQGLREQSHGLMFPLTCDYTWYLTPAKYAKAMELAKLDFRSCMSENIPFVTVCHVDPVHGGEGIRFLSELYRFAKDECAVKGEKLDFVNLKQLASAWKD